MTDNKLDELFSNAADGAAYAEAYGDHLSKLLSQVDYAGVATFIGWLLEARANGRHVFFIGNGGSASTASHFANDLAIGTQTRKKPFKALALTDNVAVMSAVANDFGYDEIFVRQLEALMAPGDLVVAISASGNSPNILKALDYARGKGAKTVALTGFDGGKCTGLADLSILFETTRGEYGPVEDLHLILNHMVGTYLMRLIASEQT